MLANKKSLEKDTNIDNVLTSCKSVEEAKSLKWDNIKVNAIAGFFHAWLDEKRVFTSP